MIHYENCIEPSSVLPHISVYACRLDWIMVLRNLLLAHHNDINSLHIVAFYNLIRVTEEQSFYNKFFVCAGLSYVLEWAVCVGEGSPNVFNKFTVLQTFRGAELWSVGGRQCPGVSGGSTMLHHWYWGK